MVESKDVNGQIQISDEVIAIIAGTAAAETEGKLKMLLRR